MTHLHDAQLKPARPAVAIISNEPTPYRLHVLRRIARELHAVQLHSLFTHTLDTPSAPWRMEVGAELNPVFFPEHALAGQRPISGRSRAAFHAIRDYVTAHHVRLIVLLGYNDLTRLLLIRWAKQANIPLLITGDSNVFSEGRVTGVKRLVKKHLVRWVIRHSAGLMPMGTCGRAFFRLYDDHAKPTFLFPYEPDYADLQKPHPQRDKLFSLQHQFDPMRRRLLYCGRLVDVKRVDVLIDAFTRIATRRADWDLVIVGDGPLRLSLMARVPAQLRNRVHWLGFLQFEETVACYHNVDVLVLPSEYEPWALVVNEAAACGLAIVATEVVGAAAELVRNHINGLVVPPQSVDALTEALYTVTDDRCTQRMKEASPRILEQWRHSADPVHGLREALVHFGVLPRGAGVLPTDRDVNPDDLSLDSSSAHSTPHVWPGSPMSGQQEKG